LFYEEVKMKKLGVLITLFLFLGLNLCFAQQGFEKVSASGLDKMDRSIRAAERMQRKNNTIDRVSLIKNERLLGKSQRVHVKMKDMQQMRTGNFDFARNQRPIKEVHLGGLNRVNTLKTERLIRNPQRINNKLESIRPMKLDAGVLKRPIKEASLDKLTRTKPAKVEAFR
jgi:hypothetical protein